MRLIISALLVFCTINTSYTQQAAYKAFTVNDGLPSNYIYRCIEDNKGFLWVATDAGIARFDGKRFQVFTTAQGLPDNEVLSVVKEKNGRIWVNCFKQSPAYFDEVKNRFINAKEDSLLSQVKEGTINMYFIALQNGGMQFLNEKGSFILKDRKLIPYYTGNRGDNLVINENKDGSQLKYGNILWDSVTKTNQMLVYQVNGMHYLDSAFITKKSSAFQYLIPTINDGKFYLFDGINRKCFIYSDFTINPIRFKIDSINTPEPFNNFEFTTNGIYLLGISGKIHLYGKKNLQPLAIVSGDYLANSIYRDKEENLWVCTIDKGLLVYQKRQYNAIKIPDNFTNTNFLSIARKPDGTLLVGNFYGEVIEAVKKNIRINVIPKNNMIFRQRKIILSQNKTFTFSEVGIYVNYTRQLKDSSLNKIIAGKTAISYNDSIIIFGQSTGLQKLNTITEKLTRLHSLGKRITAITRDDDGIVYFGSTDGLYKYSYLNKTSISLAHSSPFLMERVAALCTTPDKLVWVATSGSGVVVLKDDKVLIHISDKKGIVNNASRSITSGKPGQVWLGTSGGISIIKYKLQDKHIQYSLQNLTSNDGLTNNVINEMLYQNDTVYAATGNGISKIPANIAIPKFNIPVELIHVSVNQRDTILSLTYDLAYNQQNIQMQFAAIELNGHFKHLQYTLNENYGWINLDENILTLQLNSGKHIIKLRAIDVNGNISNKILTIRFNIATPFWEALWFWLTVAICLQLLTIYLINQRREKRKELKLAKEIAGVQTASLEQQAFTSLMNPHFMFNALNSIQYYINVQDRQNANRYLSDFASLIRKNFEAAQQSFIPLEQELENLKIYLRLEQMRFTNWFSYLIKIDEALDVDNWMIPTMMLQPLLENAVLHGIMPSAINGDLIIDLKESDDSLVISIIDNGIGIANSHALKEKNDHKSHGMDLIRKRVEALSHFVVQPISLSMSPAYDNNSNPGNKITLVIPYGLHKAWLHAQTK